MKRFAQLFERDGHQVLVTMHEDRPAVVAKFTTDGGELYLSTSIEFSPKVEGDKDALDRAWSAAERAFEAFDDDKAMDARRGTLEHLGLAGEAGHG